MKYQYYNNCVNWPHHDVENLMLMIDQNIEISRRTFLKYVDDSKLADIAESLGYCWHPSQGLTMAGDWHISYHRSKLNGKRVYYFRHSAIEYVFTKGGDKIWTESSCKPSPKAVQRTKQSCTIVVASRAWLPRTGPLISFRTLNL